MRPVAVLLGLIGILAGPWLHAEDWIGLEDEAPVLVGIDFDRDGGDDAGQALSLAVPFGGSAGYQGYYGKAEFDDGVQRFDNWTLATMIWFELVELVDFELQHFFRGNDDELEQETLGIGLSLRHGEWNFRVQLEDGDLLIFTRDEVTDFLSRIPQRLETDVSVFGFSLGRRHRLWYWQAGYWKYDYEADLGRIESSDFAQFVVKTSALAHSSLLTSSQALLSVGHADLDNHYALSIAQERSALDARVYDSMTLSWEHWASEALGFSLAATLPGDQSEVALGLGMRWVL